MEKVVGQEGQQQETFDGIGVVAKDVIGMPFLCQLVESVILDIPALVAENNGTLGRKLGSGCGGYPDPLAAEKFLLAIELPSYGVSFPRTNHSHRRLHLRPGTQIGTIPPFTFADRDRDPVSAPVGRTA